MKHAIWKCNNNYSSTCPEEHVEPRMSATTYKPNRLIAAITVIAIAAIFFCITFLKSKQLLISINVTSIVVVYLLIWIYLNERVVSIIIHPEKKMLFACIWVWYKKKFIQYSLEEVIISYKTEIGAKGSKRPSLRIYKEGKLLLEIIPGMSGWSNKTLEQIAENARLRTQESR